MKTCNKCRKTLSISDFYKAGEHKGKIYYSASCKVCTRHQRKEYRKSNPEKVRDSKRRAVEKRKEHYLDLQRRYYKENREKLLEEQREYYQKNRERILEYSRDYNESNKGIISAKKKEYYRENSDLFRYHRRKRKALERNSISDFSKREYDSLMEHFKYKCPISDSENIHLDHFIPVATGHGVTSMRNLIPLADTLNLSKGSKNPFEWADTLSLEHKIKFEKVVKYLAEQNGLTEGDYREFVFWCFENKRNADEVMEETRDSLLAWKRSKDVA